jgi:hypothetical protein
VQLCLLASVILLLQAAHGCLLLGVLCADAGQLLLPEPRGCTLLTASEVRRSKVVLPCKA